MRGWLILGTGILWLAMSALYAVSVARDDKVLTRDTCTHPIAMAKMKALIKLRIIAPFADEVEKYKDATAQHNYDQVTSWIAASEVTFIPGQLFKPLSTDKLAFCDGKAYVNGQKIVRAGYAKNTVLRYLVIPTDNHGVVLIDDEFGMVAPWNFPFPKKPAEDKDKPK